MSKQSNWEIEALFVLTFTTGELLKSVLGRDESITVTKCHLVGKGIRIMWTVLVEFCWWKRGKIEK